MSLARTACVMLHTVGNPDPRWEWSFLTIPWQLFDKQLAWLKRMGYRSVFLREYMDIALAGRLEQERVVSLTFDDGYLDNWTYAAPLLKKHGFKGSVFISTDFTDPGSGLRQQLAVGTPDAPRVADSGFLSWDEARELDRSGVIEVQSHGLTHTWYPVSSKIVDFRHPGDSYYWMDWNAHPDRKYQYMDFAQQDECWGAPVYEHKKSLESPRFYPDVRVEQALREFVSDKGRAFFAQPGWRDELHALSAKLTREYSDTEFETQADFMARVRSELRESKILLEQQLGKSIDFFCWPGGGYSQDVFDLAAEYYVGTTVGSREQLRPAGYDNLGCFRFSRIAPPGIYGKNGYKYLSPWALPLFLEEVRTGNKLARLVRGGTKVMAEMYEKLS